MAKRVHDAGKILGVPIIVTEQYPKGLVRTVAGLNIDRLSLPVFEKTCFSMVISKVAEQLTTWNTKAVLLCGIEAHACIYHTTIDLLEHGYNVHVVVDACSNRSQTDRFVAHRLSFNLSLVAVCTRSVNWRRPAQCSPRASWHCCPSCAAPNTPSSRRFRS